MPRDLLVALALVAVLEGLFLFVAPGGWKRAAEQLLQLDDRSVRKFGAVILAVGLMSLWLVRRWI